MPEIHEYSKHFEGAARAITYGVVAGVSLGVGVLILDNLKSAGSGKAYNATLEKIIGYFSSFGPLTIMVIFAAIVIAVLIKSLGGAAK